MTAGLFLGLILLLSASLWIAIRYRRENVLKSRVIAATNCGVFVTDATFPHHPVVYVNPAFLILTGYAEHEIVGQTTAILSGPDTDRASIEKLALALQDGSACRVSLRHYRKNGTSFWNEVTLTPVVDQAGRLTSVIWVMNDVSHIRQLEADLHKMPSPTFLCDLASEGMLVTTETRVAYVNRTGLKILGASSAEQLIGKHFCDIIHCDSQEVARPLMVQIEASSYSTKTLETRFLRLDGQPVDVELSAAPIMWDGSASFLVCFSDMSCRKRTDIQGSHVDNHREHAHASVEMHHWAWGLDHGAVWSAEQYRIFGYEPGSVPPTYDTFKKALHPEDCDRVRTLVEETLSSDRPYDIECRIIQPSGDIRFIRCRGVLMRGSTDQAIRMSGTIEDITDYKLVVTMAEERELQFKTVMESVPGGMLMIHHDGTISLVNGMIEHMFGYVREELLGRPVECLLSSRGRVWQQDLRANSRSASSSSSKEGALELHGVRKDSSEFPIEVAVHPIHLSSGTSYLATIVEMGTVNPMAGAMAHEFNNSLTAVLGFSELALALIPTESKAHRHIGQVITAGRKARELTQQIRRSMTRVSTAPPTHIDQEPSLLPIEVSDAVGPRR
ncbi:MAG: PAS domain-containing protein [Nitrospira sp.]